jgi:hypothetical protein
MIRILLVFLSLSAFYAAPAAAWNHRGHEFTGVIADQRLTPSARKAVSDILGAIDLPTATQWADCVKSVRPPNFEYRPAPQYAPPCTTFAHSPQEKSRMEDYVRRNWNTCGLGAGCHNTYHYTGVAIQRGMYGRFIGTNDHDIVHAINACLAVLRGKPAPAP